MNLSNTSRKSLFVCGQTIEGAAKYILDEIKIRKRNSKYYSFLKLNKLFAFPHFNSKSLQVAMNKYNDDDDTDENKYDVYEIDNVVYE